MKSILLVALVALLAVAVVAQDPSCGGNCPSGDCADGCPCGSSSNYVDVGSWCNQFSGWDQGQCNCIANHESGGNANAANENTDGSFDAGLWQVNTQNWNDCSGGNAPCDPNTNLGCAIDVWRWGGGTFKLWSTCGGCGACSSSVSSVNPKWDGSFPAWYDFTRSFPAYAFNTTDRRVAERAQTRVAGQ